MDTILRIKRASQPTVPVGTFKVRSVVNAFVTVRSVPVSVQKGGVRSNDKDVSSGGDQVRSGFV